MKKVTFKDLNGKIIETYFASDHPKNFPTNMKNHEVEDVPLDKDWFEMTGGSLDSSEHQKQYDDPDHPLNKHDEGQMYNMNEQDVNENSAGGGAHATQFDSDSESVKKLFESEGGWPPNYLPKGYKEEGKGKVWSSLTEALLNKIKLKESNDQIKIDDTIPSDFVNTGDLHLGSIYVVAGLGLTAKFVAQITIPEVEEAKTLLQMKRHGTLFYVEEGQLLKATKQEVDNYLNEPF